MTYCGSICSTPCGYTLGGSYGSAASCGLVPVYGGGALSGIGSGLGYGYGYGYGSINCTGQLAGNEIVIQPSPAVVTIPGPILSASGEPASVAQVAPCAYGYSALGASGGYSSGSCYGGYGRLGYGGGYSGWRRYSRRCLPSYTCGPC